MPTQQPTINHIQAKSILQKSGLPDADWVINPYSGCKFACKYCYAAFVGRFQHPDEAWGSYVDVKLNAPQLLAQELKRKLKDSHDIGTIFLSSVTDPYQDLEGKYRRTRQCLQVLLEADYQGKVSILTKSTMVTRDIDLFQQFKNLEVGLTITSTGDPIARYLERFAPPHQARLTALAQLSKKDIKTYAFIGPLLPHFVWHKEQMKQLLQEIKAAGASYVYMEHLNLSQVIKDRLFAFLKKEHPELIEKFSQATQPEYREKLAELMQSLLQEVDLPLAHEQVMHHQNPQSWQKINNS